MPRPFTYATLARYSGALPPLGLGRHRRGECKTARLPTASTLPAAHYDRRQALYSAAQILDIDMAVHAGSEPWGAVAEHLLGQNQADAIPGHSARACVPQRVNVQLFTTHIDARNTRQFKYRKRRYG